MSRANEAPTLKFRIIRTVESARWLTEVGVRLTRYGGKINGKASRTPSGLILLVDVGMLNSIDSVEVPHARITGDFIEVNVEVYRFHGIVGGNVVTPGLVEVQLGTLDCGWYSISVSIATLIFMDPADLNSATSAGSPTSLSMKVQVEPAVTQ